MPRSVQGRTLEYTQEAAWCAPGVLPWDHIRYNDGFEFDGTTRDHVPNANKGHQHFADTSDMPVIYTSHKEDALTIPIGIRRATAAGTPPIVEFLEACGCAVLDLPVTTVAAYVNTAQWSRTAAPAADHYGPAQVVELDDVVGAGLGTRYPVLCNNITLAAGVSIAQMHLPSATANGRVIERTFTVTPRNRQIPDGNTLAFLHRTRLEHTAGEDHAWKWIGCGGTPQELTIEDGGPPEWTFAFHAAKREAVAETLAAATFADTQIQLAVSTRTEFGFQTYNAAGSIAHATMNVRSATFAPGISCIPTIGYGGDAVGGTERWFAQYNDEAARLTTVSVFRRDRFAEFEIMPQAAFRHLHIVQPGTSNDQPCWGLWLPKCKIAELSPPDFGERYVTQEIIWEASAAAFTGSATDNDAAGMAPWYFAINGTTP